MPTQGSGTYYSPVNFLVPQLPPGDLPPTIQNALSQLYSGMQQVIQTFTNNCGIGSQPPAQWAQFAGNPNTILRSNLGRFYAVADEAIAYGAMINVYAGSDGTAHIRNANATNNTKPARGFCSTNGGLAVGVSGEVIIGCGLVQISGLTVGSNYYLSTTDGLISATASTGGGNIEQYIGFSLSTTVLYANIGYWTQH